MSQVYYQKLYNSIKKANQGASSKQASLQKQIDNKTTRLKSAGVDVDKATDTRNGFEKLFNLPKNQNFIFDALDILNRPQQAAFGAINAAQNNEDVGKGALEGLSGDKTTSFKDILTKAGMSDRKGKLDLTDVLGFAGDVALDPMDLVPVAGFGKAAQALKEGSSLKDASKLLKTGTDVTLEGTGKLIKSGAKVADTGLSNALKALDEFKGVKSADGTITKLKYLTPEAKSAANLGKQAITGVLDDGKQLFGNTNVIGRFESYKDMKDTLNRAFNYASNIPSKIKNAINSTNATTARASAELSPLAKRLDNGLTEYATKVAEKSGDTSAENIAKIYKQTDNDLANLKEFTNLNRNVSGADLVKEAKNGKLTANSAGKDGIDLLNSLAEDVNKADRGLKLTVDVTDKGFVKLSKNWDFLINPSKNNIAKLTKDYGEDFVKSLDGLALDGDKLSKQIVKNTNYTENDLKEFNKLNQKYANDENFKKLYDDNTNIFNEANSIIDKYYSTNLTSKYADNDGYVRHALDKEQFNKYKNNSNLISAYGKSITKGNTKVLADRTINMSVREANNMFKDSIKANYAKLDEAGKKAVDNFTGIFKEGLTSSFSDYLENIPKLAADSNLIDGVLVKSTFGDYKELNSIDKKLKQAINTNDTKLITDLTAKKTEMLNNSGMKLLTKSDNLIPKGFKQLTSDEAKNLLSNIDRIGSELKIPEMQSVAKYVRANGGNMAINNEIIRLIDIDTNNKSVKGFSRLYDTYLNFFKRNKVLSPTFQMNNIVGNSSNMFLAGIGPTEQAKLFPDAVNILNNGQNLLLKNANGIKLTEKEQKMLDVWNSFLDAGFGNPKSLTAMNMRDMPDSLKEYFTGDKEFKTVKDFLVDGLPYINNYMNNYMDTASRLVTFMYGKENTSFLKRLNVNTAGDAVRKVLFDPSELTSFEKNTMKKIMPFYTFTKKNLAFQLDNLSKNGTNYHKLLKAYDSLLTSATGGNNENVSDWLKNNLYIPIPALGEDGSYKVLRTSLPFGNLIDTATNPLNTFVSLVSPVGKMPFELATGVNSFTGNNIEKFKGQKSTNIPGLTKMQEYLLGNATGLDIPLKTGSRILNGVKDNGIMGGLINSTTLDNNINTDKINSMYDKLDQLETIMNQYKQNGTQFNTMNELKKINKNNKAESIMSKLNKLNGLKVNPYGIK